MSIEIEKRLSAHDDLSNYCYFAKKDDYIEVTEWANGEGYDVDINGKDYYRFTYGQIAAIKALVKSLNKHYENS